jgi:hypothetical protein
LKEKWWKWWRTCGNEGERERGMMILVEKKHRRQEDEKMMRCKKEK